jgi:hypothetical protein
MNIREKDPCKTILEVTDDEFTLIQYLLEKSAKKNEAMIKNNMGKDMFKTMSYYELG